MAVVEHTLKLTDLLKLLGDTRDTCSYSVVQRMETAFSHSEHLCVHVAARVRPSAEAPAVIFERLVKGEVATTCFEDYPEDKLQMAEALTDRDNASYAAWRDAEGPWTCFYDLLMGRIQAHQAQCSTNVRDALKAVVHAFVSGSDTELLEKEARGVTSTLNVSSRSEVEQLLEFFATLRTTGGAACATKSINPFSKAGVVQSSLREALADLDAKHERLDSVMSNALWPTSGLHALGLCRSDLAKVLSLSDEVKIVARDAATSHLTLALRAELTTMDTLFARLPDPAQEEKKFMVAMKRDANQYNALVKEIGKCVANLQHSREAKDHDSLIESMIKEAQTRSSDALTVITLHTLITLIRSPNVHRVDSDEHKWLRDVVNSYTAPGATVTPDPEYLAVAHEILKTELPATQKAREEVAQVVKTEWNQTEEEEGDQEPPRKKIQKTGHRGRGRSCGSSAPSAVAARGRGSRGRG